MRASSRSHGFLEEAELRGAHRRLSGAGRGAWGPGWRQGDAGFFEVSDSLRVVHSGYENLHMSRLLQKDGIALYVKLKY